MVRLLRAFRFESKHKELTGRYTSEFFGAGRRDCASRDNCIRRPLLSHSHSRFCSFVFWRRSGHLVSGEWTCSRVAGDVRLTVHKRAFRLYPAGMVVGAISGQGGSPAHEMVLSSAEPAGTRNRCCDIFCLSWRGRCRSPSVEAISQVYVKKCSNPVE